MTSSLRALLPGYSAPDVPVSGITLDSRRAKPGDLFIALKGSQHDGRCFISDAVARGASAVLTTDLELGGGGMVPMIGVPDLKQQVGHIASRFYGHPSAKTTVVAVTGTNGKTSVTYLAATALKALGRKVGIIGTLGQGLLSELEQTQMTTPDSITLQAGISSMVTAGAEIVLMEASSHGLAQDRLNGTRVASAILTNLTRDHLDYHGSMSEYRAAKAKLFHWPELQSALLNLDDPWGAELVGQHLSPTIITFSTHQESASVHAKSANFDQGGLRFELVTPAGQTQVASGLMGAHNLSNLVAAGAFLYWYGVGLEEIGEALGQCQAPPGRLEAVRVGPWLALVDFAHTPDAVAQVLSSVNQHFNGRIICVIGCGGDRDVGKRPMMGQMAVDHSDLCFFTSDNPRSEDPAAIIDDMVRSLSAPIPAECKIIDRRQALAAAIDVQEKDDVVVVLGKGHEAYQEVHGKRYPFSDRDVVKALLTEKAGLL